MNQQKVKNRTHSRENTSRLQSARPTFFTMLKSEKVPTAGLAILIGIALLMLFVNPVFLSNGNIAAIAEQAAVPAVVAVGMTFVILMGGIDLSLAGTMAAVSLSTALLLSNDANGNDWGFWAIPVGCLVGAGLGLIAGVSVARLRVPSFIVTIGTWQIGLGIGLLLFGGKPPRIQDGEIRAIFNGEFLGLRGAVWLTIAIVLIGLLIQNRTRFGRYSYVIGASEETAKISGVNVKRYRTISFVLAGATAGLAAVMATARTGVGDVGVGSDLLFTTIAGVVIGGTLLTGGRGGVLHSVVGVLVIVSISNAMVLSGVSSYIQQAVQGAVVVLAAAISLWNARERLRVIK